MASRRAAITTSTAKQLKFHKKTITKKLIFKIHYEPGKVEWLFLEHHIQLPPLRLVYPSPENNQTQLRITNPYVCKAHIKYHPKGNCGHKTSQVGVGTTEAILDGTLGTLCEAGMVHIDITPFSSNSLQDTYYFAC